MDIYRDEQFVWEEQEMSGTFMDYKNPQVSNLLRGYPAGEMIRLAVVFYDRKGVPFFARHLLDTTAMDDFVTAKRNIEGNHLLRHYGAHNPGDGTTAYHQHNANIISLMVSGLDVTDIKDKIGGFSIVRAAIPRTRIGSALLSPVIINAVPMNLHMAHRGYLTDTSIRQKNTYVGISPERLFSLRGFNIEKGDRLENAIYLKPYLTTAANDMGAALAPMPEHVSYFQKLYEQRNAEAPATGNGALDKSNEIIYETSYELGDDDVMVDPRIPNVVFKAETTKNAASYEGMPGNCSIFITSDTETADDYVGKKATTGADALFILCDIKRDNAEPYGGSSASSLANTIYYSTGHFQEVNEEVLAEIEIGGRYVFHDIQVFGGDTFVNLMAIERIVHDSDDIDQLNHSIVYPCESRINLAMREGNSVAKDMPFHPVFSTDGIKYKANDHKWEEFNYNDGYSSDDIKDFFLPVPYNWTNQTLMQARIRYSLEKSQGEMRDSFRVFPPLQYIDLDINDGEITNVREKLSKLVYWQRDVVGYIPIRERTLTQNPFGQPIQLGVGGIFERHDKIIEKIGNSNQFGLISSDAGFHWYDSVRKILVSLDSGMQFREDSVVSGLDNIFSLLPDLSAKDNPVFSQGIAGGYDLKNKTVLVTFHIEGQDPLTVGLNLKLGGMFLGMYSFTARQYINFPADLVGVSPAMAFYRHTDDIAFGSYYGADQPAYFDLVFPTEGLEPMIFDNMEITAGENICSRMIYSIYGKEISENIVSYTPQAAPVTRNWVRRNNKWYGSIPLIDRQRLVNDYLRVRFMFEAGFTLEQYITMVKVIYRQTL